MKRVLRIATRASRLAMWQAQDVAAGLRRAWPGLAIRLIPITSHGDRDQQTPLYGMGGIGVFCSEVQQAVLDGVADVGVHSLKDLPTAPAAGLQLIAYGRRADPRDALIGVTHLQHLATGATVASSSLRRRGQLAALRPDLQFIDIRGNVQTRLRKIREGQADVTLLAMAGLQRLGLLRASGARALDPLHECTPAPGQGIVAVDCRQDDRRSRHLLQPLDHRPSRLAAQLERAVLAGLRGGCSLPLGCHAWHAERKWHLQARLTQDGHVRQCRLSGPLQGLAESALSLLQVDD